MTFLIGAVSIGVLQGSILGPLLFALYIKKSTGVKYSNLDLYADDAEMHCSHSDLKTYFLFDLDEVT